MNYREKILNDNAFLVSETDAKGIITYANDEFCNVAEYKLEELVGMPHNIVRHEDMPKAAFKALWVALKKGENYHAIVKNLTRTGRYYWVITDFTIDKDEKGKITGYTGRRKALPQSVINKIEPLYKTLLSIENAKSEAASELYFKAYLNEEVGKSYDEFVLDLFEGATDDPSNSGENPTKIKKGVNWFFFGDSNPK